MLIKINPIEAGNKFKTALGMKTEKVKSLKEMIKGREVYLGSILSLSYDKPIFMKKGSFSIYV